MAGTRTWVFVAVVGMAVVLQGAVVPHLIVHRVKPDLVLLTTLACGLLYGPATAARVGLAGGLLQDMLLGKYVGVFALTRMTVGYLAGVAERRLYRENVLILIAVAGLASALTDLMFIGLLRGFGYPVSPVSDARAVVLPAALYNGLLAPFVYRGLHALRRWELARREFREA